MAIAQKVITAHGGKIRCESRVVDQYPKGMVEFYLTLPMAPDLCIPDCKSLPGESEAFRKELFAAISVPADPLDQVECDVDQQIRNLFESRNKPFKILVIDDEQINFMAIKDLLAQSKEFLAHAAVHYASDSSHAYHMIQAEEHDLVFTDIDLGSQSDDGFAVVDTVRKFQNGVFICVHSNRMSEIDHRRALDSGAQAFLPKPISRGQLFRIVKQAINRL